MIDTSYENELSGCYMTLKCNVLKSGYCEITQGFVNGHRGLDLVGPNYTLDDIISYLIKYFFSFFNFY